MASTELGKIRTVVTLSKLSYRVECVTPSVSYAWNNKTRSLAEGLIKVRLYSRARHRPALNTPSFRTRARGGNMISDSSTRENHTAWRVTLSSSMPHGHIRLRVDNLNDIEYEEVPNVLMPGLFHGLEMVSNL